MGESAPRKTKSEERRKPRRMVAIPIELHDAMKKIASASRRPLGWEIQLAIESYIRDNQ